MKTQFTAGPWKFQPAPKHQRAIDRKWEIVADCNGGGQLVIVGEHTGIDCLREADARLIAAAPDLLATLQGLIAIHDSVTQGQERELRAEWLPKARAAIAKATQS